jgi:hypothetical protein
MNLDIINSLEEYWGEVVDTNDPLKAGRVKIRVKTVFDEIPTDFIPWAVPRNVDSDTFEKPFLGETVQVIFHLGDVQSPKWFRIRKADDSISDENYESLTILKDKDLSKYGLDGKINIQYSAEEGLTFKLERNGSESEYTIRNDNTVLLRNGNSGKTIHLSEDGISIGSEDKSQQPAVVGDDNMEALQMLNDTIKDMTNHMNNQLQIIEQVASSSPYTKHLELPIKNYRTSLKSKIEGLHSDNDTFFPETKSTFITVDKT